MLGILPGLVGVIQATEVIKLILGIGEPLIGRLLLVDALGMSFRTLKLRKNPDCPACGTHPTVTELIDYDQFCGIEKPTTVGPLEVSRATRPYANAAVVDGIPQVTVEELEAQARRQARTSSSLDVREPHEYAYREHRRAVDPGRQSAKRIGEMPGKERRGHRPLPFRSPQPEGRARPQGGWLHQRLQPRRRHPRLGRQDRSLDAQVLNPAN